MGEGGGAAVNDVRCLARERGEGLGETLKANLILTMMQFAEFMHAGNNIVGASAPPPPPPPSHGWPGSRRPRGVEFRVNNLIKKHCTTTRT